MTTPSPFLAARAVVAVLLMIGFYLLALAIGGLLAYIPIAEALYAHRISPRLAVFCLVGAAGIFWSVLPRLDKFIAPGPHLTRQDQPRLFEAIDSIAQATGQAAPAEVYLVADVNAWVAQRGGIMGFGSRRVMGLGLPLLRALTVSQFRAVLAHEFGHYHGGDTKLGPWIYKTRGAIGRTLASLGHNSFIQKPFLWYGKLFLRITHAISRRQEFVADELAARTIGSQALIGGLRVVHGAGPAFQSYWSGECVPVLRAGFRPPLAEGFQQFLDSGHISKAIDHHLDEVLKTGKADPYDTHPPLRERIAAVERLPAGVGPAADPRAIGLLDNVPALEARLLESLAGAAEAAKLKPIGWSEVTTKVYLPQWQGLVQANAGALSGVVPESLPQICADLKAFGAKCRLVGGRVPDGSDYPGLAGAVLGSALVMLLVSRGARIDAPVGGEFSTILGSITLQPFAIPAQLAPNAGGPPKLSADNWRSQCAEMGILGVNLSESVASS